MALIPKGQREQLLIAVMFLAILGVPAYWHFAYQPKAAAIVEKEQHVHNLRAMTNRAKADIARGSASDLTRELATYEQNLDLIRTLVPQSNEVPALLEQVSTAARKEGIDLATVDPQPVIEGQQYDSYSYSVAVIGGYHQLASFFSNVGGLTRIVLPVNVQLHQPTTSAAASRAKGSDSDARAAIEARFQLQTFVARKSAPPPDATAHKGRTTS